MGRNTENAVKLFHELMDEPNDYEHIVVNALLGINLNLAIIADVAEEGELDLNSIAADITSIKRRDKN